MFLFKIINHYFIALLDSIVNHWFAAKITLSRTYNLFQMCRFAATYYDIIMSKGWFFFLNAIKVSASRSDDPKLERCLHNCPFKEFSHSSNHFSPVNNNVLVRRLVLNDSEKAKFWEMMFFLRYGCAGVNGWFVLHFDALTRIIINYISLVMNNWLMIFFLFYSLIVLCRLIIEVISFGVYKMQIKSKIKKYIHIFRILKTDRPIFKGLGLSNY